VVDLYARIKSDVWNCSPDVMSIFIGVNDVWHEIFAHNGVDIERFEKVYRALISDTLKVLPNLKLMLIEPYVLHGEATDIEFEKFQAVYEYAKVVKKLAKEFGIPFVPTQKKLDELSEKYGAKLVAYDGVHPTVFGSRIIADEWLKVFKENFN
jgi:lysophospholipase L1-like esterase